MGQTNGLVNNQLDSNQVYKDLPPKKRRSHKVVIKAKKIWKSFPSVSGRVNVLKNISFNLYSGEFVIIFGPSGCGKSTLLHTILGLEHPDQGQIFLRYQNLYDMSEDDRTTWRKRKTGMVFQQPNWIRSLNVQDNVAYPLFLTSSNKKHIKARVNELLEMVGISDLAYKKPMELSGGEQQKAALARALTTDPGIIIADEPTGNLDSKSGAELIRLIAWLNRAKRKMIIMVTHDSSFLNLATRRIYMKDGQIIKDEHD